MKIFVLVLIAAALLGGLIGGEISGTTFTVWGATIGGVVTFAVLISLGAFFSRQDDTKARAKAPELTPEIRSVFDRMVERKASEGREAVRPRSRFSLENTVANLIEDDRREFAAGRTPERRLIPQHAIKRDVMLKAYEWDFSQLPPNLQVANQADFEAKIYNIKRLDHAQLDVAVEKMIEVRTDLTELENEVRADHPLYRSIPRLFG